MNMKDIYSGQTKCKPVRCTLHIFYDAKLIKSVNIIQNMLQKSAQCTSMEWGKPDQIEDCL